MAEMWICMVVLERKDYPAEIRLEVKVLVSATDFRTERATAINAALDTPVPLSVLVKKRDGQTLRELGYHVVAYYKVEDVHPPQVVAWHYY